VTLGVSGIAFACGGNSTGGTGAPATDSQSFITEFCNLYAPCCGKVNRPTDGATCRALYGGLLGSQTYDSSKGTACLDEMRAQSNTADYCDSPTAQAPSCKGAFKEGGGGVAQPGEDCTKDGDCASSAEGSVNCASSYSGSAVTKSCQVELEGKAGDTPCISTRDGNTTSYTSSFTSGADAGPKRPAARGYVCDLANRVYCNSKTTACEAVNDVGGDCNTSDRYSCVKTAFCDSQLKKCAARVEAGGDCSKNSQSCAEKTNCDQQTKKCIAGLADGAPCTTSNSCASGQCVNGKCDKAGSNDISTQLLCGGN
jgi:hypothetical protein